MYLPRPLIAHLYASLLRTHHALAAPVLLLVALDPDALCAARILTQLLKRDYIPHKIQAIAGYTDLQRAGVELVRPMRTTDGGVGGVCICLGCGGLVDLEETLGLDGEGEAGGFGDVQVWVLDSRRPWNLDNVFRDHVAAREVLLAGGEEEGGRGALVKRTVGVEQGRVKEGYKPARGGIIVFDDGDIEEDLAKEKEAYCALEQMPEVDDAGDESDVSETEAEDEGSQNGDSRNKKRKSWDRGEDEDDDSDDDGRARRRRRSNSGSSVDATPERPQRRGLISVQAEDAGSSDESRAATPQSRSTSPQTERQPSARTLRRRLLRLRRKHESVLHAYYGLGTSYSEPVSSLLYSLASELGREDNDLLWLAIVGVSSTELYGRTLSGITANPSSSGEEISLGWNGDRGERIRSILRDEVRRLNPAPLSEVARERELASIGGVIPTHARSPTDMSIRISPEPRFLLIRHWSLYDSMLHSSYLATRLHIWSDSGQRRLHKLLAKMGVSLAQCRQSYTHMDMDLKRGLRQRLLRFAPAYGLDGLVPPADAGKEGWGFVRSWGWKASLSATDVAVVLAAILDISDASGLPGSSGTSSSAFGMPTPESTPDSANTPVNNYHTDAAAETATTRFWRAYDALSPTPSSHSSHSSSTAPLAGLPLLLSHIPTAQALHRAIMRTGCALLAKRQIRPLRAFRMGVVREGPDVPLFARPGALVQLALWVAEAVRVVEGDGGEEGRKGRRRGGKEALVLAGLDEGRGVYVVVGLGGGGGVRAEEAKKTGGEERRKRRREREERRKEKTARREERRRKRREERGRGEEGDEEELETESEAGSSEASSQSSGSSESESEDEAQRSRKKGPIRNRFGHAFQAVAEETGSRVRIDSFEHCVVEVRKEDLSGFLEALSMKAVVG